MKVNSKKSMVGLFIVLIMNLAAYSQVTITDVKPTCLFPKHENDELLKQLVQISIKAGNEKPSQIRVDAEGFASYTQKIEAFKSEEGVIEVLVPDVKKPTRVKFELLDKEQKILAVNETTLQPQKKWRIYTLSYSHQDLGYGDFPHKLRTTIRHANINIPLEFCKETDQRNDESQFRYNIETSEPILSYIGFCGKEKGRELAQRINEGRIQLGGLTETVNTELLSNEVLARNFYMSGRTAPDMLGIPFNPTLQHTDVIGMTWGMATYAKEAGFEYFFNGQNWICMPNVLPNGKNTEIGDGYILDAEIGTPIFAPSREPVYYWEGPDGQKVLRRTTTYVRHSVRSHKPKERVQRLIDAHNKISWPFSSIFSQDGNDFQLADRFIADMAEEWNKNYEYPKIIPATFQMAFDQIAKEMEALNYIPKSIPGDENNQWSDEHYSAAKFITRGRPFTELLPNTEKLASVSQVLTGKADNRLEVYQSYHRLLQYLAHTVGRDADFKAGEVLSDYLHYETEQIEHGEALHNAIDYQTKVFEKTKNSLNALIPRKSEKNLVVFNPLTKKRTDIVKCSRKQIPVGYYLVDATTNKAVATQESPNGEVIFLASDVPAMGYKTYKIKHSKTADSNVSLSSNFVLENNFYKIEVDQKSGNILSLFDKELNVELIESDTEQRFNQYLYQEVTDVKEKKSKWTKFEVADKIEVIKGDVADELLIKGKAKGVVSMEQKVLLYHDVKKIDFSIEFEKSPFGDFEKWTNEREAIFIALPFLIPDFKITHELPGAVAEPFRQQIEGSGTDHYAIRSFTDISNASYGVTVSPVEGALVCYGDPKAAPLPKASEDEFGRDRSYPDKSHLYLYLLNNMFSVNIPFDQRGNLKYSWSVTSHKGNWKEGNADIFGQQVTRPFMSWRADGKNKGTLKPEQSFMEIDAPNVICNVLKPAETNGNGYILRLQETRGENATVKISLPFIKQITSANETSLVETDREERLSVHDNNNLVVNMKPFSVKTVRILGTTEQLTISEAKAVAVADMQIDLEWSCNTNTYSHFDIYRDTDPQCEINPINLIGQSPSKSFSDIPQVHKGGWIRSCLLPETKYYYRVVPVDRMNNQYPNDVVVQVKTLATADKNLSPIAIENLKAFRISDVTSFNYVNLLFNTSVEPDVKYYEIYRSEKPDFVPGKEYLIGTMKADSIVPAEKGYGRTGIAYTLNEYDHAMFFDKNINPGSTYYYKVCAVDSLGLKGPFSETMINTAARKLYMKGEQSFIDSSEISMGLITDNGDEIRYTTDGSQPTKKSKLYSSPFTIKDDRVITASLFVPESALAITTVSKNFRKIYDCNVLYNTKYDARWASSGGVALIDNARGDETLGYNWQGFKKNDMDVVVDLKKAKEVQSVTVGCLQSSGSWVFFPNYIEVFISEDGENYKSAGRIETNKEWQRLDARTFDYTISFPKTKCRYIKVFAKNIGYNPEWHRESGGEAWLFVDEIIIE